MSLWTAKDAAAATGGVATGNWTVSGVSIDTRTLQPGDLFVALKDVRDGHDFVAAALEAGAGAALVSRVPARVDPARLLLVDDVLPALERLGIAARARTEARVIAVTGSVGKTSTKEMLRTVLACQGRTHAAEASYNNHWGVPLTLARMPAETDYAVIEIGMNHPGEIAPLSKMARPDVAMITNVAEVHLEAFDDGLEGIAREKAAIAAGLDPDEGVQVVCADVAEVAYKVLDTEMISSARRFWYGSETDNPWHLKTVHLAEDCTIVAAVTPSGPVTFKIAAPGRHFAMNGLGVLAAVEALGADPGRAAVDLARWQPPAGRGQRTRRSLDPQDPALTFELIDDAFNASPTSMAVSLETLAAATPAHGVGLRSHGRRIAVLGEMLELGPREGEMHAALAKLPSMDAVDVVHCAGCRMRALFEALPVEKRGLWAHDAEELASVAHDLVDAGDVVLVKGSKGSLVSQVVTALRKISAPVAEED